MIGRMRTLLTRAKEHGHLPATASELKQLQSTLFYPEPAKEYHKQKKQILSKYGITSEQWDNPPIDWISYKVAAACYSEMYKLNRVHGVYEILGSDSVFTGNLSCFIRNNPKGFTRWKELRTITYLVNQEVRLDEEKGYFVFCGGTERTMKKVIWVYDVV